MPAPLRWRQPGPFDTLQAPANQAVGAKAVQFQPTLKSYTPTLRNRIAAGLLGNADTHGLRAHIVEGLLGNQGVGGSTGMSLSDFVPGLGAAMSLSDAHRSADEHKPVEAALGVLGAIPIPEVGGVLGAGARAAGRALEGAGERAGEGAIGRATAERLAQSYAPPQPVKSLPKPPQLDMSTPARMARAQEQGMVGPVFHGAQRGDRIVEAGGFRADRATSGPMAYFTDDPAIASNYAKGKEDTSLEVGDLEHHWVAPSGKTGFDAIWNELPPARRSEIRAQGHTLGYDYGPDGDIKISKSSADPMVGQSTFQQYTRDRSEGNGNPLRALWKLWYEGGNLAYEPEQFSQVLDAFGAGGKAAKFNDPYASYPTVFPQVLDVKNPLSTTDVPQHVAEDLYRAADKAPPPQYTQGVDPWDKRAISPQYWKDTLQSDMQHGETHAWTSIPDFATETLKQHGYDGIKDTGGKMGGQTHNVYIPFSEDQVHSYLDQFPPKPRAFGGDPDLPPELQHQVYGQPAGPISDLPSPPQLDMSQEARMGRAQAWADHIDDSASNVDYGQTLGLRVHDDFRAPGQRLAPSRVWDDGTPTGELLPGTSTIGLDDGSSAALRRLGVTDGASGYYPGSHLSLVVGSGSQAGEDVGERIIHDARILQTWPNPRVEMGPPPRPMGQNPDVPPELQGQAQPDPASAGFSFGQDQDWPPWMQGYGDPPGLRRR